MQPLKIQLFPKEDTDKQIFYIGKLCFPGTINLYKGTLFSVYIQEDLAELHITKADSLSVDDPEIYYEHARRRKSRARHCNISIEISPFEVPPFEEQSVFFTGSIAADVSINASDGIVFLVFVADQGEEEVQISVSSQQQRQKKNNKHPDIYNKKHR